LELEIGIGLKSKGKNFTQENKDELIKTHETRIKTLDTQKKQLRLQKESLSITKEIKRLSLSFYESTKNYVYDYLMTADKSIKTIALEFGQAGGRANDMRIAIEGSAIDAARLGMSVEEMTQEYRSYVDQVGRTVSMNKEQMVAMAEIAKGTNLASGEAGKLAGQYEAMGLDMVAVNKQIQGILETSERMGVNATKVLKAVSGDFKRLQTYTFRTGVQGMGEMAAYAEKFKIDLGTALDSAERGRTLEGAVDMAAKLQVLGGEFAKSDPFEILNLSRNDPAKWQEKIGQMTKGMVTLAKVGGEWQQQIASPMARDMLKQAGDALGISLEKITEIAYQQDKMNNMQGDMMRSGYTKEQQDILTGLAQMDSSTGKFFVNVKGVRRDIADLTKTELDYLKESSVALDERAKNAQTFDDQWKIFMLELKAVGLPLLQGINTVLSDYIRPAMDSMKDWMKDWSEGWKDWMKYIGMGVASMLLLAPVLIKGVQFAKWMGKLRGGGKGGIVESMTGSQMLGKGKGALAAGKGAGLSALGKGAGVGLAGAGIGGGIMLAAKGIAELADSMSKLDKDQIDGLVTIATTLSVTFPLAAVALGIFGTVSTATAPGLLALGGAVALIGAGIGAAAWGIGQMADGMGNLMAQASPLDVLKLAGGMGALATSAMLFVNPLTVAGMIGMSYAVGEIAEHGEDMGKVGMAFANINAVLKGSKSDFAQVRADIEAISKADFSNLNAFGQLKEIFNKPLQVEFSNKEIAVVSNITLEMDGEVVLQKLNVFKRMSVEEVRNKNGGVV
jgi:cytochrome c556